MSARLASRTHCLPSPPLLSRSCAQAHAVGDCDRHGTSGAGGCRRDTAVAALAGESGAASTPAGAFRRSKSVSRSASSSSKQGKCAICFATMRSGHGQALFTAECSHMFHFHCISSNVKHGNYVCPVCRAKWKEIPYRSLSSNTSNGRTGAIQSQSRQQNPHMALHQQVRNRRRDVRRLHTSEPVDYNDDEPLRHKEAFDNLNSVKAPTANSDNFTSNLVNESSEKSSSRAPIDLVTVLDVSGNMAGTKLALMKRAMGFVVQHLGPSDRLLVIAFSSAARRQFPLRQMSHHGRQEATWDPLVSLTVTYPRLSKFTMAPKKLSLTFHSRSNMIAGNPIYSSIYLG